MTDEKTDPPKDEPEHDVLDEDAQESDAAIDLAAGTDWEPWSPPDQWAYGDPEAAMLPTPDDISGAAAAAPAVEGGTTASSDADGRRAAVEAPPPSSIDPAAAAFEAARIAEQIVGSSFDTSAGAAIVAAAAAGAAIEAARARRAAGEAPISEEPPPTTSSDPVVTARLQRDKILRALADDVAAQAEEQAASQSAPERPSAQMRAVPPPMPMPRAQSQGRDAGADDDEELDPVELASAAIQRLRQRARTDLAELRVHYQRHDIVVLVVGFILIVFAGRMHERMITPPVKHFSERGLEFDHTQGFLKPEAIPLEPPRIIRDPTGRPPAPTSAYNVALAWAQNARVRLEVLVDKKPTWSNIVTGLELDRRSRWGELYTLRASSVETISGHDWLRTAYRYAHSPAKGDEPRVDDAVEYATIDRDQIYVVTLFGSDDEIERLESVVGPSLRVPSQTGLPLVPQTRTLTQRSYPTAVAQAFNSTVMVVVADLVDGRLRARGGGSGVVVGADGSILTNYHVIHDKDGRLHDAFVIGRFSEPDLAPQLQCAGRPSRGKLSRDLDLALIKCDLDLDGRTYLPTSAGSIWPTLPEARADDVKIGHRLWVLGYPDVGGGGLELNQGEVEGFTGRDGAAGKEFIKTDASITHGNSGGPVVDDYGRLVGIASAYRIRVSQAGTGVMETSQVGIVRSLSTASQALAIAAAGWTPLEGRNDFDLQPNAIEAPTEGVRIASRVIDAASDAPIRDALVMVLRPGVAAGDVDVNRLDDQVLSWGRSNTQGDVQLKQPVPVPGTYTVMVTANGYEALIGENALRLDAKTPPAFDPWGFIRLRSR